MNTSLTLSEALKWGSRHLHEKGISSYSLDAGLLLCHAAGLSKTELYTKPEYALDEKMLEAYYAYIHKRGENMPVQYILEHTEFMGLDFYVDENVLIPRPDTECLVEAAIAEINAQAYGKVLDLCTGSGCIIISILKYCAHTTGTGLDISAEALRIAERNADANAVADRVEFVNNNLFLIDNTDLIMKNKYDVIVSNPPYIKTSCLELLDDNVKKYEPSAALDGGSDGLVFYRKIAKLSESLLNNGGMLFFEIGCDQGSEVESILKKQGFADICIKKDLAGLDRLVYGKK